MIHLNVIDGQITGSYGDTPFSVSYEESLYNAMMDVADAANESITIEDYNRALEEFKTLTVEDYTKLIQSKCEDIYVNPVTGEFFLKHGDVISTVPMPQALVDRIYESMDMGVDFSPLIKMWTRWLRNPILKQKGGTDFSNRFFNFVNLKYVHPALKKQLMEVLAKHGLEQVESNGSAFDPELHQAIRKEESDAVEVETVGDVYQQGFTLHDRLLRPAMVSVLMPKA